jgi:hypothetical protein
MSGKNLQIAARGIRSALSDAALDCESQLELLMAATKICQT